MYKIMNTFDKVPQFFKINDNQNIIIVSNFTDTLYINMEKSYELDIDNTYDITDVKEIVYEENV